MKRIVNTAIIVLAHLCVMGLPENNLNHTTCLTAQPVCNEATAQGSFDNRNECNQFVANQYFKLKCTAPGNININTYGHTGTYTLYGPFSSFGVTECEKISLGYLNPLSGNLSGSINVTHDEGYYILRINIDGCTESSGTYGIRMTVYAINTSCVENDDFTCKDCVGSFSPDPGKYILSAWVRGEAQNKNTSYENPKIEVSFPGFPGTYPFPPAGKIIDDWQRIDGIVTIPPGATEIIIKLDCQTGTCYFDDIRFVPLNGSMISYVYDPITLKLTAQLDERNYATFYEYDEEGKLIRVKKETERGIMTIQENRDNIHKK